MASHDETRVIKKDEREQWLDSRLLKTAGVVIGILTPLFVWIVVEIFSIKAELQLQKQRLDIIIEMKDDIKTIQKDLGTIRVDIATLKIKAGLN